MRLDTRSSKASSIVVSGVTVSTSVVMISPTVLRDGGAPVAEAWQRRWCLLGGAGNATWCKWHGLLLLLGAQGSAAALGSKVRCSIEQFEQVQGGGLLAMQWQ